MSIPMKKLNDARRQAYELENVPYIKERYYAQMRVIQDTLDDLRNNPNDPSSSAKIADLEDAADGLDRWLQQEIDTIRFAARILFPDN
jgi:hypothetical protein